MKAVDASLLRQNYTPAPRGGHEENLKQTEPEAPTANNALNKIPFLPPKASWPCSLPPPSISAMQQEEQTKLT
jgi:hypothetical protein